MHTGVLRLVVVVVVAHVGMWGSGGGIIGVLTHSTLRGPGVCMGLCREIPGGLWGRGALVLLGWVPVCGVARCQRAVGFWTGVVSTARGRLHDVFFWAGSGDRGLVATAQPMTVVYRGRGSSNLLPFRCAWHFVIQTWARYDHCSPAAGHDMHEMPAAGPPCCAALHSTLSPALLPPAREARRQDWRSKHQVAKAEAVQAKLAQAQVGAAKNIKYYK